MQADDWWTHHRGETEASSQLLHDDTLDTDAGSGSGGGAGPRRDRHGRWRVSISNYDDYDYNDDYTSLYYYNNYGDYHDHDDYDASGSGKGDVGE